MSVSTDNILSSTKIVDSTDQTKSTSINLSGATTATSTTLAFNQTTNRTISFPNNSGTVALTSDIRTVQNGSQSVTHDSDTDGTTKTTTVIFGSTFSSTPAVVPNLKNVSNTSQNFAVSTSSVTTSGFDATVALKNVIPKEYVVVDNDAAVGLQLCMEVVNNNPAIVHWDDTNTQIKFTRSNFPEGVDNTPWARSVITTDNVNSPSNINRNLSMAIINGNPAIAFYDNAASAIKYIRANDTYGTSWGSTVTAVGSLPLLYDGINPYLLEVNGSPAIAYTHNQLDFLGTSNEYHIRFVRANDSTGSTWGSPISVFTDNANYGIKRDTMMAMVNGNPAIVYSIVTKGTVPLFTYIFYSRSTNANGTSWPITPINLGGHPARYPYLAVINGNPAVAAYQATSVPNLYYIQASNVNGTTWLTPVVINNTIIGGPSLIDINGFPVIAYAYNGLNITRASTASGLSGTWTSRVVDNSTTVSRTPIIRIIEDQIGIGYYDQTNTQAKFARGTLNSYTYDIIYLASNA